MRQPDWSLLPPELIQFISEKILCITDYVYFRVVCRGWRLASLPKPRHLPPQLPWLLFPITSRDESVTKPEILFYDLHRSKMSTLHNPVIQGSQISGASHGWLILEKSREVFLLNPVTGANIPVSLLFSVPNIFPIPEKSKLSPTEWIIEENNPCFWQGYIWKAILTCAPSPDSECIIVGLFASNWNMAFCRIGDERWTLIEEDYGAYHEGAQFIEDISWHHNLLYALDSTGAVYIYDLYSPSKQYVVAHVEPTADRTMYLVQGASEPMAVFQHSPVRREMLETPSDRMILEDEVFEWRNEGKPAWHQVYDIGDAVLFINDLSGVCISVPCANLQLKRWHGSQICYEKRFSSVRFIELKELGNGDAEDIDNLEDLVPGYSNRTFWFMPSSSPIIH